MGYYLSLCLSMHPCFQVGQALTPRAYPPTTRKADISSGFLRHSRESLLEASLYMATAVLASMWTILVVKTALVADNISDRHGHASVVRHIAACWRCSNGASKLSKNSYRTEKSGASRFRCGVPAK